MERTVLSSPPFLFNQDNFLDLDFSYDEEETVCTFLRHSIKSRNDSAPLPGMSAICKIVLPISAPSASSSTSLLFKC